MSFAAIATALLVLAGAGYVAGRRHAVASAAALDQRLPSLARHYGYWLALWVALPSFAVLALWLIAGPRLIDWLVLAGLPPALAELPPERLALLMGEIKALAAGQVVAGAVDTAVREAAGHYAGLRRTTGGVISALALAMAVAALVWARRHITPALRARHQVEAILRYALLACSIIAVLVTLGIVLSLLFEAVRFFRLVPLDDFLFGLTWSPQTAIRADQVASAGAFGAIPVFTGTLLITFIAMLVAVPIGLFSAIYMVEYASPRVRAIAKPVIEILAGVPTVAYGALAALTVAPALRDLGRALGLDVASESALATGVVMGVMIIPFMSSLSDDVMNAVPQSLRDGALALGATRSETVRQVIIPAALPGIMGAFLLSISRAIGETMIVVMAAGLAARLTANPLEAVTTVTVQIVTLLVGDQEFDSAKTLAAFALGLALFILTLGLNVVALMIVNRYREKYE